MKEKNRGISIGTAAFIAGLTLFIPTAPYAEFYVFKKLVVYNDAAQTTKNLLENPKLFLSGVFAIFLTYLKDIMIAWSLYIFLIPVNASVSLLAAWFRIVYTVLSIVALFNFLNALQLLNGITSHDSVIKNQILQLVNARRFLMNLAYIIFGIYLIIIGILIYKATYIPKLLGVLMSLAGLAWIIISLQPYFFKQYNLSWLMIFSIGELFFFIWLLIKGRRIKEELVVAKD